MPSLSSAPRQAKLGSFITCLLALGSLTVKAEFLYELVIDLILMDLGCSLSLNTGITYHSYLDLHEV